MKVASFVIPHHLLVKGLIKESFEELARITQKDKIDRIVLISPDHFNQGRDGITISDQDFIYESGLIVSDKEASKSINKHAKIFKQEHGISGLIPFIGKYFPRVSLVAVMVKSNLTKEKMDGMVDSLSSDLKGNSLVILSADFSHFLDKNLANLHDEKSIAVISNLDYERVFGLEMDCIPGLYIIMKLSERKGFSDFKLFKNSNSSIILKKNLVGSTVSYVIGSLQKGKRNKIEMPINLLFGDNFGKSASGIFRSQDLNIDRNFFSGNRMQRRTIEGKKFTFLAYNPSFNEEAEEIFRLIEENKSESDFLIIYANWGPELERELAHDFINSGADMVVGIYSQEIYPIEIYKEKLIFYSLGNNLALIISIKNSRKYFCLAPIEFQKNYRITLTNQKIWEETLLKLSDISEVEKKLKDGIKEGLFSVLEKSNS